MTSTILRRLQQSDEPSVRFKVLTQVMSRKVNSAEIKYLREEIRESPRVRQLLSERQANGQIPHHPYSKWNGAHWLLATLADQRSITRANQIPRPAAPWWIGVGQAQLE